MVSWLCRVFRSSTADILVNFRYIQIRENRRATAGFIGIFPASHVYIRDELSDAEGRLPDLVTSLNIYNPTTQNVAHPPPTMSSHAADYLAQWKRERTNSGPEQPHRDRHPHPDRDKERDKDNHDEERKEFKLLPPPDTAKSSRSAVTVYPADRKSVV